MEIKIISRSISVTDGMRNEAYERLGSLEKFLDENQQVKVSVYSTKNGLCLSVMLVYEGKLVKVEKHGSDYYELLCDIEDSLNEKLQRLHSKKIKKLQDQEHALRDVEYDYEADAKESNKQIVKRKKITLNSMSPDDAIIAMESLGHESYIFLNNKTNKPCLIYSRNDGKYGLIETD